MGGVQSRAETGQADAPGILRQGHAETDLAQARGRTRRRASKLSTSNCHNCDVADVFLFVNGQCQFLSALTPLQPRYAKKVADADSLMAVIIAPL